MMFETLKTTLFKRCVKLELGQLFLGTKPYCIKIKSSSTVNAYKIDCFNSIVMSPQDSRLLGW